MATVSDRDSAGTRIAAATPEASRNNIGNAQPLPPSQEQNLRQLSAVGPGDDDYSERSATPAPVNPTRSADNVSTTSNPASNSIRSANPTAVNSGTPGSKPTAEIKIPSNNILHDYSNYTYQLSWHLMTISDYNNLVKNPESKYVPRNVLVASAGKYNTEFVRSAAWKEDFYFESLEMQTVIGLNARTRGTNAIDITFKLIEPYGVSLLERLLKAADTVENSVAGGETATPVTAKNYTQLPYMLQIDFLGYSDEGVPTLIPGATKYIPINVLTIEFSVTNRGAEYTIRAVPFNHQAFKTTRATIPANFEIAPSTVGDFFKGENFVDQDAFIATRQLNLNEYEKAVKTFKEAQIGVGEEGIFEFSQVQDIYYTNVLNAENKLKTYAVRGIEGALNNYYEFEKIRSTGASITIAPQYQFIIDPEIAKAKINKNKVEPKNTMVSSRTTGQISTQSDYQKSQKTKKDQPAPGIPVNAQTELYRINAGTSIIELINTVIRNSEYIVDQIDKEKISVTQSEREQQASRQENTDPIRWFKIVPSIEILGYDTKISSYALKMTYAVTPYLISGRNIARISQAQVQETQISKIYNYIYTGLNQDILDLNIEFNTQYFMAITSSPGTFFINTSSTPDQIQTSPTEQTETDPYFQQATHTLSSNQQTSYALLTDPKAVAAADVAANLMNTGADMISVKLKIIGDPAWIKQDDIFGSGRQQILVQEATGASSISTDPAEVYVRLNFRVPTDIDDVKGVYKFDKMNYSVFSGIYRVLTVTNRFERGQFTQDLELVRIPNQPAANQPRGGSTERSPASGGTSGQLVNPTGLPTSSQQPRADSTVPEQIQQRTNQPTLSPTDVDNDPDFIVLPSTVPTRAITETTISPAPIPVPASTRNPELIRLQQQITEATNRVQASRLAFNEASGKLDPVRTNALRAVLNQNTQELERIQAQYRELQTRINFGL
jgi:hypothetical protein